jgi:hypothetical protein
MKTYWGSECIAPRIFDIGKKPKLSVKLEMTCSQNVTTHDPKNDMSCMRSRRLRLIGWGGEGTYGYRISMRTLWRPNSRSGGESRMDLQETGSEGGKYLNRFQRL